MFIIVCRQISEPETEQVAGVSFLLTLRTDTRDANPNGIIASSFVSVYVRVAKGYGFPMLLSRSSINHG